MGAFVQEGRSGRLQATVMHVGRFLHHRAVRRAVARYRKGVRVVFVDLSRQEQSLSVLTISPEAQPAAGLLIHHVWRKSRQDADAWVPWLGCSVSGCFSAAAGNDVACAGVVLFSAFPV